MIIICVIVESVSEGSSLDCCIDRIECDDIICIDLEFFRVVEAGVLKTVFDADRNQSAGLDFCFLNTVSIFNSNLCGSVFLSCSLCRLVVTLVDQSIVLFYRCISCCQDLSFHNFESIILFLILSHIRFILGFTCCSLFLNSLFLCCIEFIDLFVFSVCLFDGFLIFAVYFCIVDDCCRIVCIYLFVVFVYLIIVFVAVGLGFFRSLGNAVLNCLMFNTDCLLIGCLKLLC